MKEISLTRGKVALVDAEDYEKVNQFKWTAHKDSNSGRWYAQRTARIDDKKIHQSMHRFIMGLEYGDPRKVDHKNRDTTLDNRRENLRVATQSENNRNVGLSKRNTSGAKGVRRYERLDKWIARIQVNGSLIHLGYFPTKGLAVAAYDAAALKYHKEFACTNEMLAAQAA